MTKIQRLPMRHTYNYLPGLGETNSQTLVTQPNMTYTIPQMMVRYASGQPLHGSNAVFESGDDVWPTNVDKMTAEDIRRQVKRDISMQTVEIKRKQAKERQLRKDAAIKKQQQSSKKDDDLTKV